jgi:hypothetical protein
MTMNLHCGFLFCCAIVVVHQCFGGTCCLHSTCHDIPEDYSLNSIYFISLSLDMRINKVFEQQQYCNNAIFIFIGKIVSYSLGT